MAESGRLVLITGASSGIGRASALAFVERGDRVLAVARDADRLDDLREAVGDPSRIATFPADVTDAASMEAMSTWVLQQHGVPDVVIANAGIGLDASLATMSDDGLRQVFEVNVFGLVRTIRPFVPPMTERGSGRILLISSIVGKRGTPNYSAYSSSKFALHGLADSLRCELHGSGVTVGLVCPSSTTTEFQDRLLREGPGQKRFRPRRHPPEAVAKAIVRMAGSKRREIILGLEARLLWMLDAVAPGFVDGFLARAVGSDKSDSS